MEEEFILAHISEDLLCGHLIYVSVYRGPERHDVGACNKGKVFTPWQTGHRKRGRTLDKDTY